MIKIINVYSQIPRTFDIAKTEKEGGKRKSRSRVLFLDKIYGGAGGAAPLENFDIFT